MVFNPRSGTPAPGSVGPTELADSAVTTPKLAAQSVTIAKAVAAVSRKDFFGTETNYNHTGTTRKQFEKIMFAKSPTVKGKEFKALISAKVANGANGADLEIWIDSPDGDWNGSDVYTGSGSPSATATVTSTSFALHELTANIAALSNGVHTLRFAMKGAVAASDVTSEMRQFFTDPED
jgi:hypothetical protein